MLLFTCLREVSPREVLLLTRRLPKQSSEVTLLTWLRKHRQRKWQRQPRPQKTNSELPATSTKTFYFVRVTDGTLNRESGSHISDQTPVWTWSPDTADLQGGI